MDYEDELRIELQADLTRYAALDDVPNLLIRLTKLDPEFEALWIEAIAGWAFQHQDDDQVMGWVGYWMIRHGYGWHLYTRAIALLQNQVSYLRRLGDVA